jgi:molybdopterin molybdotransferase
VTATPELLSVDEALARVVERAVALPGEPVALGDAHGRYLAADVHAGIDLPPFASSAMDGYAVGDAGHAGRLTVVGESAAGAPFAGRLAPGEAVAISTGAVVPADAEAVVPIEDVEVDGGHVELRAAVSAGAFVRPQGSDVRRGEPLLTAGTRLGPAQLGAAAAGGLGELPCRRRPRVAVLMTGSELRQPGEALGPGEIYDANGPMLHAALLSCGAEVEHVPAAVDSHAAHHAALTRALEHDVVVSCGGVSVGPHDLVRSVGRELGVREVFWRVALRPGKPLAFGVRERTLVFGLPGNPVSSLVCFELFVRPALLALQGARRAQPAWSRGTLAEAATRNARRDDLIRVRAADGDGGAPVLSPLHGQESHQIAVTAQADGLARIPAGQGRLEAGASVAYLPLQRS